MRILYVYATASASHLPHQRGISAARWQAPSLLRNVTSSNKPPFPPPWLSDVEYTRELSSFWFEPFRPHRRYAVFICGLFLRISWCFVVYMSVCGLVTTVSRAKAVEPIEMPFGGQIHVGPRNRVLDGTAQWRHITSASSLSVFKNKL